MSTSYLALTQSQYKIEFHMAPYFSGLIAFKKNTSCADVFGRSKSPIAFPKCSKTHLNANREALGSPIFTG